MKPSCRDVCEQMSVFLEGSASGPECDALRQHLAACPPCGEYLRQMGMTIEALRLLPGSCGERARAELVKRFESWLAERSTP